MSRQGNHFALYMFQRDLDNMKKWVLQYPNKETGGDLFGLWSGEGDGEGDNAVIHVVLGPGRDCTHGDYHFYQDVNYLEKVGSLLTGNYMLGHIGEWHSHHQLQLDRPSEGDCRTIKRNFPEGSCGFFLMIANIVSKKDVSFSPYIFKAGWRRGKAGEIQVIAERSPFAIMQPILKIINEGKELEVRKEKENKAEEEINNEIIFYLPDDTTSTVMATESREFSPNSDSRGTKMSKVYRVTFPPNSKWQWYTQEENRDLLREIYLGLHDMVGKVEITFEENSKEMNMKFEHQGWIIRLSFGLCFPNSIATMYVNDKYRNIFSLDNDYSSSLKTYNLSKFLKDIQDFLCTVPIKSTEPSKYNFY